MKKIIIKQWFDILFNFNGNLGKINNSIILLCGEFFQVGKIDKINLNFLK